MSGPPSLLTFGVCPRSPCRRPKYVGQFEDGKRHGLGKCTFANGTVYHDGEWENNQPKK